MTVNIPTSYEKKSICKLLAEKVLSYFENEDNFEEFNKWHINRYGVPFERSKADETT